MFAKTQDGFNLIGRKKEDIVYSLSSGLYDLKVARSFFGTSYDFKPVDRYKNAKAIKAGVFKDATEHIEMFFDPDMCEIRHEMGMFDKTSMIFKGKPGTGK